MMTTILILLSVALSVVSVIAARKSQQAKSEQKLHAQTKERHHTFVQQCVKIEEESTQKLITAEGRMRTLFSKIDEQNETIVMLNRINLQKQK